MRKHYGREKAHTRYSTMGRVDLQNLMFESVISRHGENLLPEVTSTPIIPQKQTNIFRESSNILRHMELTSLFLSLTRKILYLLCSFKFC